MEKIFLFFQDDMTCEILVDKTRGMVVDTMREMTVSCDDKTCERLTKVKKKNSKTINNDGSKR